MEGSTRPVPRPRSRPLATRPAPARPSGQEDRPLLLAGGDLSRPLPRDGRAAGERAPAAG
jgi:hypothetical protein